MNANDHHIRTIAHQTAVEVVRQEMAWDRMRGLFERWDFAGFVTRRVDEMLPSRVAPLVSAECTKLIPGLVTHAMSDLFPAWLKNSEQISQMIRAEVGRGRVEMHRAGEEVVAEMARKDVFNPIRLAVEQQTADLARAELAKEVDHFRDEVKDELDELRRSRAEFERETARVKKLEVRANIGLGLGLAGLGLGVGSLVKSCL